MSDETNLPRVLLLRVQNALQKTVKELKSTDDPNVVRAVLENGESVLYDLRERKVVSSMQDWGAEDTLKLTGNKAEPINVSKTENYNAIISRGAVAEVKPKAKVTKKAGGKKTVSKKTTK